MATATTNGAAAPKSAKQSKNAFRRAKKKADKQANAGGDSAEVKTEDAADSATATAPEVTPSTDITAEKENGSTTTTQPVIKTEDAEEVGYEDFGVQSDDPLYSEFKNIFAKFSEGDQEESSAKDLAKPEVFYDDDNDVIPDEEEEKEAPKMSKKKRKALSKLSVAELKSIVRRPELVEWTDTSAPDPRLLVSIKAARNVVPVPGHWNLKREYLSSKRGIEKPHFALPKFIAETGISEMRDAVLEKDAEKSLKQKQRDRVAPKMGKLDIDYQKLYEAFFKHQVKPELTRYGEMYYEGKEYETNLRHLRPGELSDELREALGMAPGAPPPWLINMQRYGPPPSYPAIKIAGLNAPPPPGAQWGFGPGQYGKPPVDDFNRPLYGGDIFGSVEEERAVPAGVAVEKGLWGELQEVEEEEEEEEEEAEEEEDEDDEETRDREGPSFDVGGLQSSVPTEMGGVESIGGEFTLRKDGRGTGRGTESEIPQPSGRQAYQVLEERNIRSQGFFGGERAYDLSNSGRGDELDREDRNSRKRKAAGDIEVSVDVDSLGGEGLSKREMARRYEEGRREEGQWKGRVDQDDLSEMIAEEGRKRIKKDQEDREKRRQGRGR